MNMQRQMQEMALNQYVVTLHGHLIYLISMHNRNILNACSMFLSSVFCFFYK